jgi:transcriptional regulator with XRE-family HTH domain
MQEWEDKKVNWMTINEADVQAFTATLREIGKTPEQANATAKILYHLLKKANPSIKMKSNSGNDLEAIRTMLDGIGRLAIEEAKEAPSSKVYTTGQLAKYFGVSITTINKWIASGRFTQVERERRNQHARIHEYAQWITNMGERILVKDIIDDYEKQESALKTFDSETEYLNEGITYYEQRYGGSFEEVVDKNGIPEESDDWQWSRGGKEWQYYLKRRSQQ